MTNPVMVQTTELPKWQLIGQTVESMSEFDQYKLKSHVLDAIFLARTGTTDPFKIAAQSKNFYKAAEVEGDVRDHQSTRNSDRTVVGVLGVSMLAGSFATATAVPIVGTIVAAALIIWRSRRVEEAGFAEAYRENLETHLRGNPGILPYLQQHLPAKTFGKLNAVLPEDMQLPKKKAAAAPAAIPA